MADEQVTVVSTATPAPSAAPSQAVPAAAPQKLYEANAPGSGLNAGDPANWTPAQKDAHTQMADLRGQMYAPDGSLNHAAKAKWNELRDFIYGNGALPKHMAAPKPAQENRLTDPSGFKSEELASLYEPATSPTEYKLKGKTIPGDVTSDPQVAAGVVDDLRGWMTALKMPVGFGSEILQRVLHHSTTARDIASTDADGAVTTFYSGEGLTALVQEAERVLAGNGGYEKTAREAQAWLDHCLTKEQMAELQALLVKPDGRVSSVMLDPLILLRLSSLAKAHGIVKS